MPRREPDSRIERLTRGHLRLPKGQTLPADAWERRHLRIKQLLWLHVVAIPALGVAIGHELVHSGFHGGALAAIALLTKATRDRRFRSAVTGVGLLTASALLVHIWEGAIEAHFHFFIVLGVLALYEDWIPFSLAVVYVVGHHAVLGSVAPQEVYSHAAGMEQPLVWAAVHGAFICAAAAVHMISWKMREELRERTGRESHLRAEAEAVASTLQQSLRPERLPEIPGTGLSARYLPAGTSQIGGDWYDAVDLGDGRAMLAIGDVAGHGAQAASRTSPLRHSFRAYALEGMSPAEIAKRLDALFEGDYATFVCIEVDVHNERIAFANAGHLPPVVVAADGTVRFLEGTSPPLGAGLGDGFLERDEPFEAGSLLLVYTDGLIERPGKPIADGLAWLAQAAAGGPADAESLSSRVVAELDPSGRDDVAVLTLALEPRGSRRFERVPEALAA